MQNLVAVLYSKEQKCWHVETLQDYCYSNLRFLLGKSKAQQYRLITVVKDFKEAKKFITDNYKLFDEIEDKSTWYNDLYKTQQDFDKAVEEYMNS